MTQALRRSDQNAFPAVAQRAARVGAWAGMDLTGGALARTSATHSVSTSARAMARLMHGRGLDVIADDASAYRGVLIDLRGLSMTASQGVEALREIGLRVRAGGLSGVSEQDALLVDTTGLDDHGLDEAGARQLASAIADRLQQPGDVDVALRVKRQVRAVADRLALVEAAGRGR